MEICEFFYLNHPIHLALSYGYVLTHLQFIYVLFAGVWLVQA